jgi:hypothetical protein
MRAGGRRGRQTGNLGKREASAPIFGAPNGTRNPCDRCTTSAEHGRSASGDDFKCRLPVVVGVLDRVVHELRCRQLYEAKSDDEQENRDAQSARTAASFGWKSGRCQIEPTVDVAVADDGGAHQIASCRDYRHARSFSQLRELGESCARGLEIVLIDHEVGGHGSASADIDADSTKIFARDGTIALANMQRSQNFRLHEPCVDAHAV